MSVSEQLAADIAAEDADLGRHRTLHRLVEAHQAGDADAFTFIVRMAYPQLYRHAARRLGEPRAAEDAVQEAFLRAYRGLDGLRGDYHVSAWLHRILANVCADEGNRRRREAIAQARLNAEPDAVVLSAEDSSGRLAVARAVAGAIASLPPNYREALLLRDVLELEYADVATRAGISEQNARARVHRARAALRRLVDSSAMLGGAVLAPVRRSARAVVRTLHHLGPSAATAPDALSLPARASVAASGMAAAAIAVAAAVPVLTAADRVPAPAAPPTAPAQSRATYAAPRRASNGLVVQTASAPPTVVAPLPIPTTGAAAAAAAVKAAKPGKSTTKLAVAGPVAQPAAPVAAPTAAPAAFPQASIQARLAQSAPSSLNGPGWLNFLDTSGPTLGSFQGQFLAPANGCPGTFSGTYVWHDASGHTFEADFTGQAVLAPAGASPSGGSAMAKRQSSAVPSTTYDLLGSVLVAGDPASGFNGPAYFVGALNEPTTSGGPITLLTQLDRHSSGPPVACDGQGAAPASGSASSGSGPASTSSGSASADTGSPAPSGSSPSSTSSPATSPGSSDPPSGSRWPRRD